MNGFWWSTVSIRGGRWRDRPYGPSRPILEQSRLQQGQQEGAVVAEKPAVIIGARPAERQPVLESQSH